MTAVATTTTRGEDQIVHAALLYRDPEQLRLAVGEFVHDAARAGEPVLALLPAGHLRALDDVLDAPGVESEDMAQAGRNPARLIPMLEGWLAEQAAPAERGARARVISEPLYPGRSESEVAECLRHEALLNLALAHRPVSVLCPYDAEHLDPELLDGVERTHPQLIDDAGPRPSVIYGDPADVARGLDWPQVAPPATATELAFDGNLAALRRALLDEPALAGLPSERREDYVFAINEVATNALRHSDGTAIAQLWRDGDRIVTEVQTPTPVSDPLAGRHRPSVDAFGGRGLWLVNQLCDLVELRNLPAGSSVRMHIAG
jgi:anti-sigma regulatory factor (Ser/Thr protein kinase)